ncbi:hypothetical protein ACXWRW_12195, partial [Streptococcus pyogenes]
RLLELNPGVSKSNLLKKVRPFPSLLLFSLSLFPFPPPFSFLSSSLFLFFFPSPPSSPLLFPPSFLSSLPSFLLPTFL